MVTAHKLGILLLTSVLVACSPDGGDPAATAGPPQEAPPPAAGAAVVYACQGGDTVEVRYGAAATADLTYRGQSHALRAAAVASGARYAGPGLDWRTLTRDGREEAVLRRVDAEGAPGAVIERCVRSDAGGDVAAPAPVEEAAGPPPCRAPALTLALESTDAGAGNRGHTLALTNAGSTPCTLDGYPTVRLLDAAGDVLTEIRSEETLGSYFRPGETPRPAPLAPGATGYFDVLSSAIPHGDETDCPQAVQMRVTPPGDTAALALDAQLRPCGGRIRVTPVRLVAQP